MDTGEPREQESVLGRIMGPKVYREDWQSAGEPSEAWILGTSGVRGSLVVIQDAKVMNDGRPGSPNDNQNTTPESRHGSKVPVCLARLTIFLTSVPMLIGMILTRGLPRANTRNISSANA